MALKGELRDLSVADLVKIHCIGRARARVKITHNGGSAELYFDNGNIIDAHYDNEHGVQAIHLALALLVGKYQVELHSLPTQQTIQLPWEQILKEWEHPSYN